MNHAAPGADLNSISLRMKADVIPISDWETQNQHQHHSIQLAGCTRVCFFREPFPARKSAGRPARRAGGQVQTVVETKRVTIDAWVCYWPAPIEWPGLNVSS
jgi:hypothetical protein